MSAKRPRGLFIAGTDTGIGKTYVASIIARSLAAKGRRVGVYKPVLSGYTLDISNSGPAKIEHCQDDDVLLWKAAGSPGELLRVAPQRFQTPLAAPLAAKAEGRTVDDALLLDGLRYWEAASDIVLVEAAGGLFSPLTDEMLVADLALEIHYPVVLVSDNRLGAINQVLQAVLASQAYKSSVPLAAIVLNDVPRNEAIEDRSRESNFEELSKRVRLPLFQLAANSNEFRPAVDWYEASCHT